MRLQGRRPWRRCSACLGVCHWHDTAWVCRDCGAEWDEQHDARFAPPEPSLARLDGDER